MKNIKDFKTFINEMLNYDNFEIVPKEYCQGLNPGDAFQFNNKDYIYVVGQIIYPKRGDPKENGCVEYWPEVTPVANPSMFHLFAIEDIEDGPDFKIITLKKD